MEERASTTDFKLLEWMVTIPYIAIGGIVMWGHEEITTGIFAVFLLVFVFLVILLRFIQFKRYKALFMEPIVGVVAEIKGGGYSDKKMLWANLFAGGALLFNGSINVKVHSHLRISILALGVIMFLLAIIQWLAARKNMQVRVALLEDRLIFKSYASIKSILLQDVSEYINWPKKIKVKSEYNEEISIEKRDFEANELKEFEAKLEVVLKYWMKK